MSQDLMSINTVAARLGLSVHQLRRWELMFGLEIKRGRGQQRQYRPEDMTILERIKELVEQGWPTSQIRPQIEAEGLITPKLIGMPNPPGNPEVVLESLIGMRTFCERRFIEISRQIDELRQLIISLSLRQDLAGEATSPWQPVEHPEMVREDARPVLPPQEIAIGPEVKVAVAEASAAPLPKAEAEVLSLGEITDQNYLTILGRALDLIGWTDEEADEYSEKTFGVTHWDELGRSQTERLVAHLVTLMNEDKSVPPVVVQSASSLPSELAATTPPVQSSPVSAPASGAAQIPSPGPGPALSVPAPASASAPTPAAGSAAVPGPGPLPVNAPEQVPTASYGSAPAPTPALAPAPTPALAPAPTPASAPALAPAAGPTPAPPLQPSPAPAPASTPGPVPSFVSVSPVPPPSSPVPSPYGASHPATLPTPSPAPSPVPPPAPVPSPLPAQIAATASYDDYFEDESANSYATTSSGGFGVAGSGTPQDSRGTFEDDYGQQTESQNPSPPFEPPA